MYKTRSGGRSPWKDFLETGEIRVNRHKLVCSSGRRKLLQRGPRCLCAFALFSILYVSFVVSRSCSNGSIDACTGNMILDNPIAGEEIKAGFIFGKELILEQNDSRILDLIKRDYLIPPTDKEYRLKYPNKNPAAHVGIIDFVLQVTNKEPGFFVEAGAHDGEYLSNTLTLEKEFGWTGLLVEPDPKAFGSLRGKNRKSWLTNVCLSVSEKPEEVRFQLHKEFPELGRIPSDDNAYDWSDSVIEEINVKCFPVFSLLSALNVTTVDFFSLDVEGAELKVLKTIPFDSIKIRIFVIEHAWLMEGKKALVNFMRSKGYILLRKTVFVGKEDSIFVHSRWNLPS